MGRVDDFGVGHDRRRLIHDDRCRFVVIGAIDWPGIVNVGYPAVPAVPAAIVIEVRITPAATVPAVVIAGRVIRRPI